MCVEFVSMIRLVEKAVQKTLWPERARFRRDKHGIVSGRTRFLGTACEPAREYFGFEAGTRFEDELGQTVQWYRSPLREAR
jgi:hypothetical protein